MVRGAAIEFAIKMAMLTIPTRITDLSLEQPAK